MIDDDFRPSVSIVIPVFNGSDYLREAIDSALAQDYPLKEIIVVDDGSDDGGLTEATARSYGETICYVHKSNGGVASALNTGIRKSTGDYVSWLSHDDAYVVNKISEQVRCLGAMDDLRRESIIPYSNFYHMDASSAVIHKCTLPSVPSTGFYQALLCEAVFVAPLIMRRFGVNGCTTLIPRRAFDLAGHFDENLRTVQDYDMWFRLNRHFDFVHMDDYLLKSRLHMLQGSKTMFDIAYREADELFHEALDYHDPSSDKFSLRLPEVALALRMHPRKKRAFYSVKRLLRMETGDPRDIPYIILAMLWNDAFRAFFYMTDVVSGCTHDDSQSSMIDSR